MANLRRPSKDKDIVGRFIKPDGRCKKHPKHRQSPGVCSLCLRDKLALLSASSSSKTTAAAAGSSCSSSASSLSSYYSSSASSCASPLHPPFPLTSEGKRSSSVSIFVLSGKHGLIKSRSMAVVPRRDGEGGADSKKIAKKSGFWSKLFRPRSKRVEEKDAEVVVRSRSVRETATVAS